MSQGCAGGMRRLRQAGGLGPSSSHGPTAGTGGPSLYQGGWQTDHDFHLFSKERTKHATCVDFTFSLVN